MQDQTGTKNAHNVPLFSIIIPAYGRAPLLAEAIESVANQTVRNFECIVVDDGSPEPLEVVDDSRFRLIRRQKNEGPAVARNAGLQDAVGRHVIFLDSDDLFTPDRLEIATEGLRRAPIAICWRQGKDGSLRADRSLEGHVYDRILDESPPGIGQVAILRNLVPAFDVQFSGIEDVEWWLRLTRAGPVATVSRAGYVLRRHQGPRNRNDFAARAKCGFLLLEKHAEYFRSHPRAASFRWKKIGLASWREGDWHLASIAFRNAFHLRPRLDTLLHWGRSALVGWMRFAR
jgi:glycosyltransferase involved in cell wall biosynthesis